MNSRVQLKKRVSVVLTILLLLTLMATSAEARSSAFTNRGTGPLYTNTYDYQNQHNSYFPESRMQPTIDWMKNNFKSHGFEYVCLDGWINGATRHTANGYVTTHNDSWSHDWKYWGDQCAAAGLKLGVYYPPYWILDSIADDTSLKVEGTDYTLKSICSTKKFENWYLVDPTKPGAQQYVQGFIKYLIGQNVKLLKADFLGNYEDQMGTTNYKTVLGWMNSACGDSLLLSLSAPNNYSWAVNERANGDMVRLSQDCYGGGWGPFSSNNRNGYRSKWPQYDNAFDAFVDFSDLTGKSKFLMDADFTIAHSYANDDEIKSAVSLQLITGSGLGIGDGYDSINGKEWAFQNDELLACNANGVVAWPVSKDKSNLNDSEVWKGQDVNGDWIVGLFNRESSTQIRTIHFSTLGISGNHMVRDLWAHADLGVKSSLHSVSLAPHACQIIRISSATSSGPTSYEAEAATLSNGALKTVNSNASGGYQVNNMGGNTNGTVTFNINVSTAGNHTMTIYYATQDQRTFYVTVNSGGYSPAVCAPTGGWNTIGSMSYTVNLNAGNNTIKIDNGSGYAPNLDRIEIN